MQKIIFFNKTFRKTLKVAATTTTNYALAIMLKFVIALFHTSHFFFNTSLFLCIDIDFGLKETIIISFLDFYNERVYSCF